MDTNVVIERPQACDSTVPWRGPSPRWMELTIRKVGEACNGTIRESGVHGSQARSSMQASAKGSVPCAISWIGVNSSIAPIAPELFGPAAMLLSAVIPGADGHWIVK